MGVAGTKEPPRNVTFENQLLLTEAALQQLQSSVGKDVPNAVSQRASQLTDGTQNNAPLPTIETSGTVETWRALSSSVNDVELKRLREEYKQKLIEHEKQNRDKYGLSKENLERSIEKLEKKFSKYSYVPVCELERNDIEKCYINNSKHVLLCSELAEKFIKCVNNHREMSMNTLRKVETEHYPNQQQQQQQQQKDHSEGKYHHETSSHTQTTPQPTPPIGSLN
ncbi:unnamed protein product [Didymodactylos carnosus]|uniref:MICOS complex subunit MIC19 n=1 Tax=Didymodactylos carnosus TaxID=1234261 RepID=A0A8S2IEN9_9BILA|nr:unnamed protein product [Didymodactylos carnosus]CAF3746209.1 unnamed protein product [Didymodactylos carnosus]